MTTSVIHLLSMAKPVDHSFQNISDVHQPHCVHPVSLSPQGFPFFSLLYKSMRSRMCGLSASFQYTDYASAESVAVMSRLASETKQWSSVYQATEKSLLAGLGNRRSLRNQIKEGSHIICRLCSDMQEDAQRWIKATDTKQRIQSGAIVCYRFHSFLSHALSYMNRCEAIVAIEVQPHCTEQEKQVITHQFIAAFTVEEWIEQTFQLLPAVSEKDRKVWLQYMQMHLPASAWYPYANAEDLFMTLPVIKISHNRRTNASCKCSAAQKMHCYNAINNTTKKEE